MKHLVIKRWPEGSYFVAAVSLTAHLVLGAPAATSGRYPPIDPFWWQVAPYLGAVGIVFLPLFDDNIRHRHRVRDFYVVGVTFVLAWVVGGSDNAVLLGTLFAAALLLGPVIVCVYVLEALFAAFWARFREFTDEQSDASQGGFRFSITALLATVAVVAMTLGMVRWYVNRPASPDEIFHQSRSNLRRIAEALWVYHSAFGELPYDERGPDAALYALRGLLDVSAFDGAPRKRNRARWDDDAKVLVNNDFAYLNTPVKSQSSHRIVACSMPIGEKHEVLYTDLRKPVVWERVRRIELPKGDVQQLLGSWITVKGKLVADARTFNDWCQTHPFFSGGNSWRGGSQTNVPGTSTGVTIRYQYSNRRLIRCTVTTPKGQIEETVETDQLGRIVGVVREPEDWQTLLPSPTPSSPSPQ